MGRPVVLSNGRVFVGLNEDGLVHDFYYPYVGLENLTNARSLQHKIGIWVNGQFSWIDDGSWQVSVDFESNALVSNITMKHERLQVSIKFVDFVDCDYDAFIRRVELTNHADHERDIRIFMHQVFQISRAGRADTALFVPDDRYLLDYKGRCCLLIAGIVTGDGDFDQFAVGNYGIEGKSGTFKDAEDGELSGNLVEHGGVDSVLRFQKTVVTNGTFKIDYWIVADTSQASAQLIHTKLKYRSIDDRLAATRQSFQQWISPALQKTSHIAEPYRTALLKSLLVIKAHCDVRGSVLASGDSTIFNYGRDYYCYCWPRDASYALWPLIRLGMYDEAKRFFDFAKGTMHKDGYLMHKYQPDRAIGSTWHPMVHGRSKELAIQEDETASVLFLLGEYYEATGDRQLISDYYHEFIYPAATFMTGFVDDATGLPHASYDLWEQKFSTSTYTVCTVIAGLEAAISLANVLGRKDDAGPWKAAVDKFREALGVLYHPAGYFRKGYFLEETGDLSYDDTLDVSSLYGPFMFARLGRSDERLLGTAHQVEQRLFNQSPIGGVIRYEHDGYFLAKQQYPGNPWIVCTAWLAQYHLHQGQTEQAQQLLDWLLDRGMSSGVLSEQFDPEDGSPLGVAPLVWSHAEVINTILDLYQL
jgi:GH15 family glucan-1,4-alpha-glucosidase